MVGGAVTGASADMTGILHRGAVAPAAPAATLPTEATTATTTTTVASTTTTSLAAALPTTGGERGLREADILATTAMADSPATTEVRGTILDTTMATDTTQVLAMDTTLAMAMAITLAMATTTEEVASETVNVLPTSSAVIFGPATNAQDQTIMGDTKLACLMFILVDQTIMVESTRLTKLACLMFIWVYNYSILIWIYN